MANIHVTTKKLLETGADCLVFFVEQDFTFSKEMKQAAEQFFPQLQAYIKDKNFTGATSQTLLIPVSLQKKDIAHLLFIGIGKPKKGKKHDVEQFRRSLGTLVRVAERNKFKSIAFTLPVASSLGVTPIYLAKQIATIVPMATYHFDQFITQKTCVLSHDFEILLVVGQKDKIAVKKGLEQGAIIAHAVNEARHWVDLPPAELTPIELADNAKRIAQKHNLKITIFDEKKVNELGMGGLAAVSRGSDRDCRFVVMEYKAKKKGAQTLAFVGKGITFDSGGLSLKPSSSMDTMKEDMSGAAAAIASMDALAQLKPDVNIICVAGLSENLPSGKATMPGDIVRFYNGKTAEVKNTDAEGRLVLADALSYVVKHYKPDAIVDLATLTGSCQHALGPFFSGLMTQHEDLKKKIEDAAEVSGDRVWAFPFHDDYKPAIKSDVADISNIGSKKYMAGAITAGFFLQHFVDDVPWAHLDIAGTAFNVPAISYYRMGATGVGVRLLVELALAWK